MRLNKVFTMRLTSVYEEISKLLVSLNALLRISGVDDKIIPAS